MERSTPLKALQKNLLYFSGREPQKIAMEYLYGKRINLVGTSFSDPEMYLETSIKDEWVHEADGEM